MTIVPNGKVELFKNVSLEPSYKKTFFFENATAQDTYFTTTIANQKVLTNNNVTYMREKRNTVRLQLDNDISSAGNNYVNIKDVYNCNYMRFRNRDTDPLHPSPFVNKWYYAFVLDVEYVNPVTIEVTYKIDVMQTWLPKYGNNVNDYELGSCLVLRNHTISDVVGEHLEPEDFGTDESTFANNDAYTVDIYESETIDGVTYYKTDWYVVLLIKNDYFPAFADAISSALTGEKHLLAGRTLYSGVYNGLGICCMQVNYDEIQILDEHIAITNLLTGNGLVAMYMCPAFFAPSEGKPAKESGETDEQFLARCKAYYNKWKHNQKSTKIIKNMTTDILEANGITPPNTFGSYTPINNKMKTYPYNYLYVTDNRGGYHFYRYEFFTGNKGYFYAEGCFTTQPEMMIYPVNYKGQINNYEEKMVIDSFPMCAWQSPDLVDWLAKGAMLAASVYTGNPTPAISTTTQTTTDTYDKDIDGQKVENITRTNAKGEIKQSEKITDLSGYRNDTQTHTKTIVTEKDKGEIKRNIHIPIPHIAHSGMGNTDIMLGTVYNQTFDIYQMQILPQFAQKIDDYFSRYGYRINDVTTPNINARPKFTFVQTSGCCMVTSNIPASVEDEICQIFDRGITFWNDKTEVDKYRYALYQSNVPATPVG